jgi:hypothetical protein
MRTNAVLTTDTSAESERVQVALWRRMSPLEKLRAVSKLSRSVQELSLAGIRLRHPDESDDESMLRLAMLKLGRRLAGQVYPAAARLFGP